MHIPLLATTEKVLGKHFLAVCSVAHCPDAGGKAGSVPAAPPELQLTAGAGKPPRETGEAWEEWNVEGEG